MPVDLRSNFDRENIGKFRPAEKSTKSKNARVVKFKAQPGNASFREVPNREDETNCVQHSRRKTGHFNKLLQTEEFGLDLIMCRIFL